MTTERLHHPHSPSKLQCEEACPKYQSSFSDNEASKMGTAQHDMADSGEDNATIPDYKAMAVVECMKFVDERFKLYPGGQLLKEEYLPIDDEKIRIPEAACWRSLVSGVDTTQEGDEYFVPSTGAWHRALKTHEGLKEFSIPFRRRISPRDFVGTTAGYLDVGIVSKDGESAEVIDFKFGQVAVEDAKNNLQGLAYLLGLKKKFPKIKKGTVWFVMPHRDEISGCEFSEEHLNAAYLRIKTVVARAQEANREEDDFRLATPALGACLFCSRIGKCPKVAEVALRVGKKYAPLEIPDSISTTVFTNPEQIEKGLKLAQVIKTWAEAYRAQATNKTVDDPTFIPKGYDLVSSAKRKVLRAKDLGELAKTFLPDNIKPKVEDLYDLAIGSVEKLISTAAPRGQKEKTVETFGEKALESGFVELGQPFAFLRQSKK